MLPILDIWFKNPCSRYHNMNLTSSTVLSLTGTWFLKPGSNMNLISSRDLARTCIACLLDRQFFENPPIWAGKIFYEKGFLGNNQIFSYQIISYDYGLSVNSSFWHIRLLYND